MTRVTVAFFTWSWELLEFCAVSIPDDTLAKPYATHRFIMAVGKLVLPQCAGSSFHSCLCLGEPTRQDILEALPKLKKAHAQKSVRFVESTENWS